MSLTQRFTTTTPRKIKQRVRTSAAWRHDGVCTAEPLARAQGVARSCRLCPRQAHMGYERKTAKMYSMSLQHGSLNTQQSRDTRFVTCAADFGDPEPTVRVAPQALYALVDQELHGPDPRGRADSTAVVAQLTDAYGAFTFVKGTHPQASNQHLIGYGGSYYNYAYTRCV